MIENVKIVVVDDDPLTRKFCVDTLTFCVNREVKSFYNGFDAWRYLDQPEAAHLIIADANLPDLNGFQLAARVKAAYPERICILMSSIASHEQAAGQAGADVFLAKPFDLKDLFAVVQTYVVGEGISSGLAVK